MLFFECCFSQKRAQTLAPSLHPFFFRATRLVSAVTGGVFSVGCRGISSTLSGSSRVMRTDADSASRFLSRFATSFLIPLSPFLPSTPLPAWSPEHQHHQNIRSQASIMAATIQPTRNVVIVGGGIVGASIAYYLSRSAASSATRAATKITLIEASSAPAPGASGKAGGFLALDWHGAATASLAELSYKLHRQLADQDGGQDKWGYREVETWQVNIDSSLKNKPKKSKSAISWLDQDIVKSTANMGGGGTTAQVHPGQLTQHLVDESLKAGVQVLFNAQATGLSFKNGNKVDKLEVKDVKSGDSKTIDVDDLVIAAGPWTGSLISRLFPPTLFPAHLKSASSIDGSRAHSVVIESHKPLSADCLFTDMTYGPGGRKAGAPELYCRSDGTAYVCGGSDDVALPEFADEVGFDEEKIAALLEQSKVLSPSSLDLDGGATLRAKQACYLPISNRTGNPIIGGKEGVYVAAGHSCWGITNSLGTGKVLSELILDGKVQSANIRGLTP